MPARDPEITDLQRRISGQIIYGRVSQVDHAKARYRVRAGDLETDWIPRAVQRAGGTRTYESLDIGEQVIVASPAGEPAQGAIIGSVSTNETQAGDKGSQHRTVYPDGTVVEYDDESKTFRVAVAEGGSFDLAIGGGASVSGAGGNLTLSAPGGVDIQSSALTHNGVNIGDTHVHGGVEPGSSNTEIPH